MNRRLALAPTLIAALALGSWLAFQGPEALGAPALQEEERIELVLAQPFRLEESYVHDWRRDGASVTAGYLLVLEVPAEKVRPTQAAQPVLFAGRQTLERLNVGFGPDRYGPEGGLAGERVHVVAVLPAPPEGDVDVDLALDSVVFHFGAPRLPEAVDARLARRALDSARQRGHGPADPRRVASALERGGGTIFLEDRGALHRYSADLIERFSPAEVDLVRGLRVPLLR